MLILSMRQTHLVPVWLRKREVSVIRLGESVLQAGTYAGVGVRALIPPPAYIVIVRECCYQSGRDASEGSGDDLEARLLVVLDLAGLVAAVGHTGGGGEASTPS